MHIFNPSLFGPHADYINSTISILETIDENQESSYRQIGHETNDTPAIQELID
jgi:hypothetical protein